MTNPTLKITYIGHATTLIETENQHFLTDPNFSKHSLKIYPRAEEPGLQPSQLPKLSGILISNARYDHLDIPSLKFFDTRIPILAPKGSGPLIQKFYPNPLTEVAEAGQHRMGETTLHSFRVEDYSFRFLPLHPRPAMAYLLETPAGNIYFTGHTSYGPQFKKIRSRFKVDVALLPLTSAKANKLFSSRNLSPQEALQAMQDLDAKFLIPIRYGTFKFPHENTGELLQQLLEAANAQQLRDRIVPLKPGESFSFPTSTVPAPRPAEKPQDPPASGSAPQLPLE